MSKVTLGNKFQFPKASYLYNPSSISTDSVDMMGKFVFVLKNKTQLIRANMVVQHSNIHGIRITSY